MHDINSQTPIAEVRYQGRTPQDAAAGILFRNVISRATLTEHAIARATEEQQYAMRCADRFPTTRWSAVLLSAQVATEGRLTP